MHVQRVRALLDARRPSGHVADRRRAARARRLVADDASGVVDLRARHDGRDRRRGCDGSGGAAASSASPINSTRPTGLMRSSIAACTVGIFGDVQALRVDRDRAHEEEQSHGGAHENADDEHEAVEELLIVLAQRRAPEPESGRDYSRRPCRIEAQRAAALPADRTTTVAAAQLQCLGDVLRRHRVAAGEIGDRSRNLQHPHRAARAQAASGRPRVSAALAAPRRALRRAIALAYRAAH